MLQKACLASFAKNYMNNILGLDIIIHYHEFYHIESVYTSGFAPGL